MRDLNQEIYSYLLQYPPALEMYDMLEKTGNIYLIGGILREYKDKGEIQKIRDIDIIIEVTVESYWQELLKKYQPNFLLILVVFKLLYNLVLILLFLLWENMFQMVLLI